MVSHGDIYLLGIGRSSWIFIWSSMYCDIWLDLQLNIFDNY